MTIKFLLSGHVDHGKSTILGHLLYQIGAVPEHEFAKAIKGPERQVWSKLLDTYEEEQQRGKTMEFSKVDFSYQETEYQMIDTPGHKQYILQLIAALGEATSTIGCLVVSAIENEFESGFMRGGQTREDLIIMRVLGIKRLVVIVNKMDAVDWQNHRYVSVAGSIGKFAKDLKFQSIVYVPVSGYAGTNLTSVNRDICDWYDGSPLLQVIKEQHSQVIPEVGSTVLVSAASFVGKTKFLMIPPETVITREFTCVAHVRCECANLEIAAILPKIVSPKNIRDLVVVKYTVSGSMSIKVGDFVLLRRDSATIGYCVVERVYPI